MLYTAIMQFIQICFRQINPLIMKTKDDSIQLTGRPGNKPFVKELENNNLVAMFSFATNEKTINEEGKTMWITHWHKVVAWGNNATLVKEKVKKGMKLSITGKNTVRQYADKDGVLKEVREIILHQLSVCESETA